MAPNHTGCLEFRKRFLEHGGGQEVQSTVAVLDNDLCASVAADSVRALVLGRHLTVIIMHGLHIFNLVEIFKSTDRSIIPGAQASRSKFQRLGNYSLHLGIRGLHTRIYFVILRVDVCCVVG